MDGIVNKYLWASVLLIIVFIVLSSTIVYWFTNRISTTLHGPVLYNFSRGGPTLAGIFIHALLFFGIVFGVIDYVYTSLNGDDDSKVKLT